jgi:hypothetical protein
MGAVWPVAAIGFWWSGDVRDQARNYDRYQWEVRWLVGATGGAVIGALLAWIPGFVAQLFRRNQNRGQTEIQQCA